MNRKNFENMINKLYFEIENDLIDNLFDENYRELEKLSLKVDFNKLDKDIIKKYKKVKEYRKKQDDLAFTFDLY